MEYRKEIFLPLIIVTICIFVFGLYGHFEFTSQSYAVWKFGKHWSGMGASATADILEKIGDQNKIWQYEYKELPRAETEERFFLKNAANPNIPMWSASYMEGILISRILNEMEKRYSNDTYRAFVMDINGFIPTGKDRTSFNETIWDYYTGDFFTDSRNYSHRFFHHFKYIDSILNSVWQKDDICYVGSQIVIGDKVWGYMIVSFDIKELKLIRDEILRRIILLCILLIGIPVSIAAKKL